MSFSFKPSQVGEATQTDANNPAPISSGPVIQASVPLGEMPFKDRVNVENKIGLFQLVLYIILGLTVLITVTLFGYRQYLLSSIETQKKALDEKDASLGTIDLEKMRALSNRIKVVNQVLNEHASVRTAFTILEKSINDTVTYKGFDLKRNLKTKNYDLKVGATASSYKAMAQQLDTINNDKDIKSLISKVTYDGPTLDTMGNVNFSLTMAILIQGKLPESIFSDTKTDTVNNSLGDVSNIVTSTTTIVQNNLSNKSTTTNMVSTSTKIKSASTTTN